jgi:uncharacterized protein YfaT (DUF1175 family)
LWTAAACIGAGSASLFWIAGGAWGREPSALLMSIEPAAIPADGVSHVTVLLRDVAGQPLRARDLSLAVVSGNHSARAVSMQEERGQIRADVEAGVMPGRVTLEARSPGAQPVRGEFATRLDSADSAGDGTPDFLRLNSPADRDAFRRWFRFLAEVQALAPREALPAEIVDCAALARFAYREALRAHDATWAGALRLSALPAIPSVEKYVYPFTPVGAALFRVRPGPLAESDVANGAFAEFADAKTLSRFNAHYITRQVSRAVPGDLLFYRQASHLEARQETLQVGGDDSYHTMIFLGPSQLEPGAQAWVAYHTGPLGAGPGEIRRVTIEDLLRHPEPRWRPVPGNPYFLGVYRWNILRGDG